jgi:hypothetical protein
MEEVSDKSNFPLGHSAFLLTFRLVPNPSLGAASCFLHEQ